MVESKAASPAQGVSEHHDAEGAKAPPPVPARRTSTSEKSASGSASPAAAAAAAVAGNAGSAESSPSSPPSAPAGTGTAEKSPRTEGLGAPSSSAGGAPAAANAAASGIDEAEVGKYTLAELQGAHRGGALDIDFARKEEYLTDADFMKAFHTSKAEFRKLPAWRQKKDKQSAKLF